MGTRWSVLSDARAFDVACRQYCSALHPVHNWHLMARRPPHPQGRLVSHQLHGAPFLFSEKHNATHQLSPT